MDTAASRSSGKVDRLMARDSPGLLEYGEEPDGAIRSGALEGVGRRDIRRIQDQVVVGLGADENDLISRFVDLRPENRSMQETQQTLPTPSLCWAEG